tara:strand:- start:7743 stop:8357 length:615 start_codon:yes stop_codon:yes gene_type:complete
MEKFDHEPRDFFRSDGEMYFSWWLDDMMDEGYIDDWTYEEEVFDLAFPVKLPWKKQLKTKVKDMEMSFLEKCTYNPDFKIYWNEKAKGEFYHNLGEIITDPKTLPYFAAQDNISRIEIKPNHDFQNKTAQAVIKIKWLMQLGTYVQLVIPVPKVSAKTGKLNPASALFNNTFIPRRFAYTNATMKPRKINFKHITLKQWQDIKQ